MQKNICVFCSSSDQIDDCFFQVAQEFGKMIAQNGCHLIYGGANVGLMGVLAKSVQQNGGKVIGVIPEMMQEISYREADELIVTEDLRERKAIMENRSDAFIGLPGGFGTLDEIFEFLTLKQLNAHNKPIIFLNTRGFYDQLIHLFETFYRERFAHSSSRQLYHLASDVRNIFHYLRAQFGNSMVV